jgi:hypothetical protein
MVMHRSLGLELEGSLELAAAAFREKRAARFRGR